MGNKRAKLSSVARWTRRELDILRRFYTKEGPVGVLQRLPGRSRMAVCKAASELNLRDLRRQVPKEHGRHKSDRRSHWTKQEITLLLRHYPKGGLVAVVVRLPGRSVDAIRWRVRQNRLRIERSP